MKIKIIASAHHRNGIGGATFHAILFEDGGHSGSRKIGIVFDQEGHCAVLDLAKLALADIAFGSNSWRGDQYEPQLRRSIKHGHKSDQDTAMTGDATIPRRVDRCDVALRHYTDDGVFSSLIDFLADAMHWSDATGEDFHYALCLAGKHYVAELNDEQSDERRMP